VKTRILSALLLGITLGIAATVTIRPAAAEAEKDPAEEFER
jgi:hypothetical protein